MAVLPMIDVAVSQLSLYVEVSGPSIAFLYVQALLAVFYRPAAYAVGAPVFSCQHSALSGRRTQQGSLANEPPDSKAQHVCTAI